MLSHCSVMPLAYIFWSSFLSAFSECAKILKTSSGVLYNNSLICMKPGLLQKTHVDHMTM